MNIVILHCHFQRGGVTQVVENHVRFLQQSSEVDRVLLISGPRTDGLSPMTRSSTVQRTLDGFDYDTDSYTADRNQSRARVIADDLSTLLASEGLLPSDTVLHWHNHSLGKNTAAPLVIAQLATQGWPLLLQIHDFAEDNRPQNYRQLIDASGAKDKHEVDQFLYPTAGKIHYVGLTHGDTKTLSALGRHTSLLFNSVTLPADKMLDQETALSKVRSSFHLPSDASWTLYPVRGIRRKNVGEWLLLTQLLPAGWYSGLTLEPASPIENNSYQRWKALAATVAPAAVFDAGHHDDVSFADNLSACSKVFSTSVAEGFGMTFLEPWLAQREVIARRLVGVTSDFEQAGVKLDAFYDSIPIPGLPQWLQQCWNETESLMNAALNQIPLAFRPSGNTAHRPHDCIDFALLTPQRQAEVLCRIAVDPGFAGEVKQRSNRLVDSLTCAPESSTIQANADVIAQRYSIDSVGTRLIDSYRELLAADPSSSGSLNQPDAKSGSAVDLVNQNRPFYPCRTEVLPDA